jgi:hypothetical protein
VNAASTPRRTFLHIGAPKTGTTFLQSVLAANRARLSEQGLLYPGNGSDHFHAALDLRDTHFMGHDDPTVAGAWSRVVGECRSFRGDCLISHEIFGLARRRVVRQAIQDLSFTEVPVVVTARDLARQAPAVWQESIKNRSTSPFADFMAELQSGDLTRGGAAAWRSQRLDTVLRRWAQGLDPSRVHVVTLPPPGAPSGTLLARFAELVDVDPAGLRIPEQTSNASLGVAEAATLRRLNQRLPQEVTWSTYQALVKVALAERILAERRGDPIVLSDEQYAWARSASRRMTKRLRRRGYDVVGRWKDLIPPKDRQDVLARDPDDVSDSEIVDVAIDALLGMVVGEASEGEPRSFGALVRRGVQEAVARLGA